jgi:DNA replication ATP-dependent helicase Dna2
MPSAPLGISSQSRTKLTTIFERRVVDDVDDKENVAIAAAECLSAIGSERLRDADLEKSSPQLPQLPTEKHCPQTPVNRIPLADLIGNTEDAFNCDPKDTTPEDHIYWQHGPTPRSSIPSATGNSSRRGKKRARSSSPASSSQNQKSTHFPAPETLDLKTLHESLKTPHNDPALDLWARYTDASLTKKDANGNALPAFAHLMTSSPQTPGTSNSKDSGLRRSMSCGIEWPTSKAKKRKLTAEITEGRARDIFGASKTDIIAPAKSKASRITMLMEKLQENSKRAPQIEVSGPSSSSPLPNRIGIPSHQEISPVQKRIASPLREERAGAEEEIDEPMNDAGEEPKDDVESISSEFGDEDLGLDILEAVEQSACTQTGPSAAVKSALKHQDTMEGRGQQTSLANPSQHLEILAVCEPDAGVAFTASTGKGESTGPPALAQLDIAEADDDDDEFNDGSDDNLAMADLAAQFDTQEPIQTSPPRANVEQLAAQRGSALENYPAQAKMANDDDAYDDDDDDLWNQIGDGSTLLQQGNNLTSASQVRIVS